MNENGTVFEKHGVLKSSLGQIFVKINSKITSVIHFYVLNTIAVNLFISCFQNFRAITPYNLSRCFTVTLTGQMLLSQRPSPGRRYLAEFILTS
jgi:hypothetical protein